MVNSTTIVGRITADPKVKKPENGNAICNFTTAVGRNFKNADGIYDSDFIQTVAFGKLAERMQKYVNKGDLLGITGRIQTRNYENKDGQRVYVTELIAESISFYSSKKKEQAEDEETTETDASDAVEKETKKETKKTKTTKKEVVADDLDDDDLPF